jgi:hypothetical protein
LSNPFVSGLRLGRRPVQNLISVSQSDFESDVSAAFSDHGWAQKKR